MRYRDRQEGVQRPTGSDIETDRNTYRDRGEVGQR